jgi:ubiquinone/menaquinone biosynthesis C-methylase UbiE
MLGLVEAYYRWRKLNFTTLHRPERETNLTDKQLFTSLSELNSRIDNIIASIDLVTTRTDSLNIATLHKLLKYGVSYAEGYEIFPPVGIPSDFFDDAYIASHNWWQDEQQEWWREEINWLEILKIDQVQLPHQNNREGYFGDHHLNYWIHGYRDYRKTLTAIEPYGVSDGRYFDFGGSTGRVFRHFAFQSEKWDVWSSDFKPASAEWNLRFFPNSIKSFLNNSNPSLPLPDSYFNLVTAYSVFTHINETETPWLSELRRILKVGGVAFISIHDELTWENLVQPLRDAIVRHRPDIAELKKMPEGKTVVTFREDDPYNCHVFHSREYIERVWGRFFEICEIKSLYHDQQAVVICRRLN